MKSGIEIDPESKVPVYKQLIENVRKLVAEKRYKTGDFLPSMNKLSDDLQISKETIKKAYSILRDKGIIESAHGKGFYVSSQANNQTRILLLFDKLSTYKQVLYSSFTANIKEISEITIHLHNQDVDLFEYFIDENLNKFDYYIITPHFPLTDDIQKRVIKALRRIPNRKLLLLDRYIEKLPGNFGSIYQDFEEDVIEGLTQGIDVLRKFKKLNVISMPGSLYAPLIETGIKKFCKKNRVNLEIYKDIDASKIEKGEAYLILNSQLDYELIELVRIAKEKGCEIGTDIGIISYNESPINEIILNGLTVLSTDFRQMGELAAQMIMDRSFKKRRCNFKLVRRHTF